jgi:subtilisin family serine protease
MLDDGFNYYMQHEATTNQVIAPGRVRDFVDGDWMVENPAAPPGQFQHGTWTFASAGGYAPGSFVGAGYGAEFALGRTEDDPTEHVVEMVNWGMGAEWADSLGADIISSSLGYSTFDFPDPSYTYADMNGHTTIVTRAAEIAASKGILVVNSAGNAGNSSWYHIIAPADADGDSLIAVGAVDLAGTVASFSSRGPTSDGRIKPDLCAYGTSNPLPAVSTPLNPTGYVFAGGTSFSAPLIAGLAACLLQSRPSATPVQIIQALRASASQAGSPDNNRGYGIPDALDAFNRLATVVGVPRGPLSIKRSGPNPLRAGQNVVFELSSGATPAREGVVRVHDAQGRVVRHLWTGDLLAVPSPLAVWDGRDDSGLYVNPGLYFASLQSARARSSARVVFLR